MLVTTKEMFREAQKNGYAVGAFNIENMEMAMAVVETAAAMNAPVMIQTTPSTLRYTSPGTVAAMVTELASKAPVPIALHLDHGSGFPLVMQAIRAGYSSVMIDGSQLSFEENIALSARTAEAAHACGIPVEAELGMVGGKEDDTKADRIAGTDPAQAAEFVSRTGVDSLAVAIGNAHGFYKGVPHLDRERLAAIRELVEIPLVLHGASGLSEEEIHECVRRGICKVNFATDLRVAYTKGVRACLEADPACYDPKKYGKTGMAEVRAVVENRILICGSNNKA